jgi:hypothetical protein
VVSVMQVNTNLEVPKKYVPYCIMPPVKNQAACRGVNWH